MTYILSVIYPAGTNFKKEYYLESHMPLVQKLWAPQGLTAWRVAKYADGQPYAVQAWLEWESKEKADLATNKDESATAKTIFGDVPNFSDQTPVLAGGELAGFTSWLNAG
ncbi:hypothetical protein GGR51DRAFT_533108 [Nemania sp. FL0031]|nr:hypothetical protein GGR51DRAFT_533108 [Nemania sp. FL0031]